MGMAKPSTRPGNRDPKQQQLLLDRQLCFALYSASLAMTRAYAPLLADLRLTYPQYLAMLVLWETDGLSLGEVGARLFLDSGTLTPLMKRLEAQGLVERRRGLQDERTLSLHLTREGRALRRRASAVQDVLRCTLDCVQGDLPDFIARLKAVRGALNSHPSPENHR